ncbi:MAG: SagB/ThcOx family dehydrogenase [Pyramidobacter sp.]
MKKFAVCCAMVLGLALSAGAAETISLPEPVKNGGPALLDCLAARRSTRTFADGPLSVQQLSDLLWAAGGQNRPDGKLVYPTALNVQDLQIYAVTSSGVFRYDPHRNVLIEIEKGDYRAETGVQAFTADAAVNLVYVQDKTQWKKLKHVPPEDDVYGMGCIHAGEACQNASLYAASRNWACVVRGSFDRGRLGKRLRLSREQVILLTQSLGPRGGE